MRMFNLANKARSYISNMSYKDIVDVFYYSSLALGVYTLFDIVSVSKEVQANRLKLKIDSSSNCKDVEEKSLHPKYVKCDKCGASVSIESYVPKSPAVK